MDHPIRNATYYLFQSPVQLGLLLLVMVLSLFLNLEAGDLSLMEARNFVTAREMTREGNWLLPTMNGHLRLAKPPLPTWITALAGLSAGHIEHIPALRFPAAVMASLLVIFTYLLARQLTSDRLVPFLAAMVLATSFAFVQTGRQGTWDIYCHSFMGGAIWLFVWGLRRHQRSYGIFILCGILLACSFLSKGPVSFYALLLPFLLAYFRGYGPQNFRRKKKEIAVALLVCLLLSIAWPGYVYYKVPLVLAANATQESTAWMERHVKPFWFYWSFPVETGIWTIFAAATLVVPYARPRIGRFGSYRFLVTWTILAVILLSVIPEKKERYLFPVLVPMALLTGHYLRYLIAAFSEKTYTKADFWLVTVTTWLLVLVTVAAPYLTYRWLYQNQYLTGWQYLLVAAWTLVLGAGLLYFYKKKQIYYQVLVMIFLQLTVFVVGIPPYFGRKHAHENYQSLQAARQIKAVKNLDFYALGGMPMEQVWELGCTVDSFRIQAPLRPDQLPAALFSPTPLKLAGLSGKNITIQEVRNFHYHKEDPAAVFHLYILSERPRPANRNSGM